MNVSSECLQKYSYHLNLSIFCHIATTVDENAVYPWLRWGVSVHRKTVSCELVKCGLLEEFPLLKENHNKSCLQFARSQNKHVEKKGALVRREQNLTFMPNEWRRITTAHHSEHTIPTGFPPDPWPLVWCWWQHLALEMLLFSRDREHGQSWWEDRWSQILGKRRGKPAGVCKRLLSGLKVHFPAGQQP